jgi:hypothetical protein
VNPFPCRGPAGFPIRQYVWQRRHRCSYVRSHQGADRPLFI